MVMSAAMAAAFAGVFGRCGWSRSVGIICRVELPRRSRQGGASRRPSSSPPRSRSGAGPGPGSGHHRAGHVLTDRHGASRPTRSPLRTRSPNRPASTAASVGHHEFSGLVELDVHENEMRIVGRLSRRALPRSCPEHREMITAPSVVDGALRSFKTVGAVIEKDRPLACPSMASAEDRPLEQRGQKKSNSASTAATAAPTATSPVVSFLRRSTRWRRRIRLHGGSGETLCDLPE